MSSLNKEIVLSASPEVPKSANVLLVQVGALVSRACDEADYQRSLLHFKIANHNILRHYDLMNRFTTELHVQNTIHQLNQGMSRLSKMLELMKNANSTYSCHNWSSSHLAAQIDLGHPPSGPEQFLLKIEGSIFVIMKTKNQGFYKISFLISFQVVEEKKLDQDPQKSDQFRHTVSGKKAAFPFKKLSSFTWRMSW